MPDQSPPMMTQYLLGELSEGEREAFEARYFEDPAVFTHLADVESALVDDYVRGRLAPDVRRQFERHYLADPARRERVRFAEALVATVDRTGGQREARDPAVDSGSPWHAWLNWLGGPRLAGAGAAAVVVVAVAAWLFIDARRGTQPSTTATAPPATTVAPANTTAPVPPAPPPVLAVVTLSLTVGPGERSAAGGEPATLTIPPGTDLVQLALTLREHDYARYRVIVRAIGGAEVIRTGDLVPAARGAQPAFTLTLPAARLPSGDYLLTLQGATGAEFEDLSQTIFRMR